jgi:HEAT repeat protein
MIKALEDEYRDLRRVAAFALGEIGDERGVEPLIKAREDEYEDVRWAAAWALGRIGD